MTDGIHFATEIGFTKENIINITGHLAQAKVFNYGIQSNWILINIIERYPKQSTLLLISCHRSTTRQFLRHLIFWQMYSLHMHMLIVCEDRQLEVSCFWRENKSQQTNSVLLLRFLRYTSGNVFLFTMIFANNALLLS